MKRAVIIAVIISSAVGMAYTEAAPPVLDLNAPAVIHAGDPWQLTVTVGDGTAGASVDAVLYHGLQHFQSRLTLGTGGIALWDFPAGTLTQAGTSVVVVRTEAEEARQTLTVLPGRAREAELFVTYNNITAYGEGTATVLLLVQDEWGNAPEPTDFYATVRYPNARLTPIVFNYWGGLGWVQVISRGAPGRVRITMQTPDAALELLQVPGPPHSLTLMLMPDCVVADGRDRIQLRATVQDAHGNAVADGTLVMFTWDGGIGYGRVTDGAAGLWQPAPNQPGMIIYQAQSGDALSAHVTLTATETACYAD